MPIDYLAKRPQLVADTECYPNLWAIGFRNIETKQVVKLKMGVGEELDRNRIGRILRNHRVYTFNGINYDLPMIALAMSGASCEDLKRANDDIILSGIKYWEFYTKYEVSMPDWLDHIDLMEVAPSSAQRASLKKYAGMMHSHKMQELPYDPDHWLADHEVDEVMDYLDNDLEVTDDLATELQPQIRIRNVISTRIGVDCRSKSDAQIGEAIMRQRVEKRQGGKRLYKPDIRPGVFHFEKPDYIEFKTPAMQDMLARLLRAPFVVKHDGYVQLPEIFGAKKKKDVSDVDDDDLLEGGSDIVIGGMVYKMGIGGLHSQEKSVSYFEDDEYLYCDNDVTGYYPNLIIKSKREPDNMRGHFQPVYKAIVDERAIAKRAGRKDEAESGKIASNGLFGKSGSPYSIVYAPRMLIQTTVSGQLAILMLIEECELNGWQVVSANTDGFVTRVPRADRGRFRSIIFDWECATGLNMEETFYKSLHSRNVNNYVAFKYEAHKPEKIDVKRKGKFAPSGRGIPAAYGLKKTPDMEICYDAVVAFLKDGTPIETTIRECQDIRKFVTVRRVKGGAFKDDEVNYIGKVVRYYYGVSSPGPLQYLDSGNNVPMSYGAQPCMELPDELPGDIDYEYYEREGYAILDEIGVDAIDPTTRGRTGQFYGRQREQKTIHRIAAATGVALCGHTRESRRDLWVEYKALPHDARFCSKCRKVDEL